MPSFFWKNGPVLALLLLCPFACDCTSSQGPSHTDAAAPDGATPDSAPLDRGADAAAADRWQTDVATADVFTPDHIAGDGNRQDGSRPDGHRLDSSAAGDFGFVTTHYIDSSLAAFCQSDYNPQSRLCDGSAGETAYHTFAAANSAASGGTRFWVRAGSYSEVLHITTSGQPGAYIGYIAYESETVTLSGVSSQDNGEDYGPIWFDHADYVVVDGIDVANSAGFVRAVDAHHNVVQNCLFDTANGYPGASKRGGLYFAWSHHNRIINNQILRGTDSLALIHSNHNLVQGNRFDLAGHDVWSIKCGSYNVIRANEMTNPGQKLGSVFDCEAATTNWHGNGEFRQDLDIKDQTQYNLIEDNLFHDADLTYYSTSNGCGIQYAGQHGIIRRNIFYSTNVGICFTHYSDEAEYNHHNRTYNNVFHDNRCGGVSVRGGVSVGQVSDNVLKNNIFFDNKGWDGDCGGTSAGQIIFRQTIEGHRFVGNAMFSPLGDQVVVEEFGSGHALGGNFSGASWIESTLLEDPHFVNAAEHDYHLDTSSTLINAGVALTQVTSPSESSGSTTLQVEDVGYFYDGFGIAGESGDLIQIAGQSVSSRVLSIDYAQNTMTLEQPLTWTQGDGVGLAHVDSGRDLGVYEQ